MSYVYEERIYRAPSYEHALADQKRLTSVPSAEVSRPIKKEGREYSVYIKYRRLKPKKQRPRHLTRT